MRLAREHCGVQVESLHHSHASITTAMYIGTSTNISYNSRAAEELLFKHMASARTVIVNRVLVVGSFAAAVYMPTTGSDPSFLLLFIYLSALSIAPVRFRGKCLPYLPPVYYSTGCLSTACLIWGLYARGDSCK